VAEHCTSAVSVTGTGEYVLFERQLVMVWLQMRSDETVAATGLHSPPALQLVTGMQTDGVVGVAGVPYTT
jgi:hypothetical protein